MKQTPVSQTELVTPDPAPGLAADSGGPSIGFFAIGIVINVLLITAYFIWALRQRNKPDRHDD